MVPVEAVGRWRQYTEDMDRRQTYLSAGIKESLESDADKDKKVGLCNFSIWGSNI